jgi:carbamoylphosphate synthase small subunit
MKKNKTIKTYNGGSWIYNSKSSNFEDADVVVMPGGGDWNPALYGHKPNGTSYWSEKTDATQMALIDKAVNAGKLIVGICRGGQGLTIKAGGFLIQDISHPSNHNVVTFDGRTYNMNSCHHQLCYPYELPKNQYEVLSWTEGLSNRYKADVKLEFPEFAIDLKGNFKEPEVIWFPAIRGLSVQGHPEWGPGKPALDFINNLIIEKLNK